MTPLSPVGVTVFALFCLGLVESGVVKKVDHGNITDIGGRIVGGSPADIVNFPYQVALLRNGGLICGASLISNRWVLTAAHCLDSRVISSVSQISVRVGSSFHNSGGQVIGASSYKLHESYHIDSVDYDIALIYLASAVTAANTRTIEMDPESRTYSAGETVTLSGWGDLWEGAEQGSIQLMTVQVPVVSQTQCGAVYGSILNNRMWCGGYSAGGKDSCQGDSGGPAVINGKLAGVVSYGAGCARPGLPGVYANVPAFRAWIKTNTGI